MRKAISLAALTLLAAGQAQTHAQGNESAQAPSGKQELTQPAVPSEPRPQEALSRGESYQEELFKVTEDYCKTILARVDDLVSKEFFDGQKARTLWKESLSRHRAKILSSSNLSELSSRLNEALKELKTSHTQFVTINDETFYFLNNLFASVGGNDTKGKALLSEVTGFATGGPDYATNEVRFVLDASPAMLAGIKRGDIIKSVAGKDYRGLISFAGLDGPTKGKVGRLGKELELTMSLKRGNLFESYEKATRASVRVDRSQSGTTGYIHLWCGGQGNHDTLEDALTNDLAGTSGLIIDLRDGYGGNSLEDFDVLNRPAAAYPVFKATNRAGKTTTSRSCYTRPVVALINRGSRSGKELLAYSLKSSKRGTLVGDTTAGAVVGGRLFPIDDRCALFLAVVGATVNNELLEGKGVAPHTFVKQSHDGSKDEQLDAARKILLEKLQSSRLKEPLSQKPFK